MKIQSFSQHKIWLTGASSGIGCALAIALAKQGAEIVISGRNEQRLQAVKEKMGSEKVYIVPFDVTDKMQNITAVEKIKILMGGVDIVILNAGDCKYVNVKNFDSTVFEHNMKVNFFSIIYGIEAALPLLRKSKHPCLVGMTSIASYTALPRTAAYGASKAAARYALESLRLDLAKENIPISIVCPGFVKTPLTDKNKFSMPMLISSEAAADHIIKGLKRYSYEIHFPKLFSWSVKLFSCLPGKLRAWFIKKNLGES